MSSPKLLTAFDTLRNSKVSLELKSETPVKIYCCGPTVYGFTHIGNARAALTLDLITRILNWAGYQTRVARNFTDIDDKIIETAQRESKDWKEVAGFYTDAYVRELHELSALSPDVTPKATESIDLIISYISKLITSGLAYSVSRGESSDVYFRVRKFPGYGKLSRQKMDEILRGVRIDADETKEFACDFALWKAAKPGEPFWESPWGKGRPGWHIECSAMIERVHGDTIDIHMGGLDLIFPHHENEIAQSEGLNQKPLARYWLHNGLLQFGQEKMSKSLGNIVRTSDFLRDYGAETLRALFLQAHYRAPLDASEENFLRAEALVERLYHCKEKAISAKEQGDPFASLAEVENALCDDFGATKALGLILREARMCFRDDSPELWTRWAHFLPILNEIFGLTKEEPRAAIEALRNRRIQRSGLEREVIQKIEGLLRDREQLRREKKFEESDRLRLEIEKLGVIVMDGPDGSGWMVKKQ